MFVCSACTSRASTSLLRRLPAAEIRLTVAPRTFATSPISRQIPASDPQNLSSDWGELEVVAEKQGENEFFNQGDRAAEQQKALRKLKRATKKELKYTTDPYHIADNVVKKLEEKDFEKALMLTREASKDKQVVVSWNHLLAYEFKNQKLHAAIKLYNEMKKRAQLPNVQTYTIIFRGCAESKHPSLAVSEAFKIYNAMLASTRLKPNQIHLNAMLELCARAQDLETLFTVLRSANGQRTPNNLTYTIILNALRYQRSNRINPNENEKEQKAAVYASIATTVSRSKLVWDEVITRWKKGEVIMDEELMCAMGRVLLLKGPAETNFLLAMVGEVLGITNLLDGEPGFIEPSAQKAAQSKTPTESKDPAKPKRIETAEQFEESDTGEDFSSTQPEDNRHAQPPPPPPPPSPNDPTGSKAMARMAGNNTLSLVMRALAYAKRTKLAARYWDYLLQAHNIVPDRRNYRDYIDCLSTGAASGKAARVLVSMPSTIADGNLYRRGILLCHWDAFNEKNFENATLIHDAMVRKLRVPDPRCMKLYLEVAMTSYRKFEDKEKFPNEREGKKAHAQQMLTALNHVWEPMRRVTSDLGYSGMATTSATPEEAWQRLHPKRMEVIEVARKFIGTSDKILSQGLIEKGDQAFQPTVTRRRIMQAFVDRWETTNKQYAGRGVRRKRAGEAQEDEEHLPQLQNPISEQFWVEVFGDQVKS